MNLFKSIVFSKFFSLIKSWKRPYVDFSQLGEEKIIHNILLRISSKFKIQQHYIDIGGFHPILQSNTYKLYQKGWSGIIIEPNPNKTKFWNSIRPRDLIINSALVPYNFNKKEIKIFKNGDNDPTESTIPKNENNVHQNYFSKTIKIPEILSVCEKNSIKPFFLNIDIEGFEDEIILDLAHWNCKIPLICVEIVLKNTSENFSIFNYKNFESVKFLEKNGYFLVSVCGISLIFCHNDYWVPYYR